MRKPVFGGFVNSKGVDQSVHPRSLISAFVIHFLTVSYQNLLQEKFPISS